MFRYSTEKEVVIKNVWLRLIKLVAQLLVLAYIGWNIFYEKGYQKESEGFGFTQVKVKGNAYSEPSSGQVMVWDNTNIVVPAKELDALFLTTNYLITRNQTRSICDGKDNTTERCPCTAGKATANGIETGECGANNMCKIYAWCPLENDVPPTSQTALQGIGDFSVYVKTFATWSDFDVTLNNVKEQGGDDQIFNVADMVEKSGWSISNVSVAGAAIGVLIDWDCNFDRDYELCSPSFNFVRLDDIESPIGSGYNFRYTHPYRTGTAGDLYRDLFKVYGIRFVFVTFAKAKQFDIVSLAIKIGSAIGMLVLANYMSDLICMWLLPYSHYYRNKKFMNVDEQKKDAKRMEWKGIISKEQLNKAYF